MPLHGLGYVQISSQDILSFANQPAKLVVSNFSLYFKDIWSQPYWYFGVSPHGFVRSLYYEINEINELSSAAMRGPSFDRTPASRLLGALGKTGAFDVAEGTVNVVGALVATKQA